LTGVALYAVHAGCDPVRTGEVKKADQLVPTFVTRELKAVPGMLGLFTACIFCGVLRCVFKTHIGIGNVCVLIALLLKLIGPN
jgi:hypothetical protein